MQYKIQNKKYVVGTKETIRAITSGNAKTVFMAQDAGEHMKEKILTAIGSEKIEVIIVETMKELGNSCGIARGAVAAAIID